MPNRWLVKTDPRSLSFDDMLAQRRVTWRDVTQPLSLGHLRGMRRGDDVFVYHSGSQRAVVGTARVRKGAYPDPEADDGDGDVGGPALVVVDLSVGAALPRPVPLAELKAEKALQSWELVRIPRIHVMPVSATAWRRVLALARR